MREDSFPQMFGLFFFFFNGRQIKNAGNSCRYLMRQMFNHDYLCIVFTTILYCPFPQRGYLVRIIILSTLLSSYV